MYATLKPYSFLSITLKHVDIVKMLLDQGANVNIQNEVRQWWQLW